MSAGAQKGTNARVSRAPMVKVHFRPIKALTDELTASVNAMGHSGYPTSPLPLIITYA